jgi:PiT family inorganic phosphate transporter
LKPEWAIAMSAAANFLGALTGTEVAKTIGAGLIEPQFEGQAVVAAALIGAIFWNLFTWYYGLPVSSSHSLIGGYAGAAIAKAGWQSLIPSGWTKTLVFIVMSPVIGMGLALIISIITLWIFRGFRPARVDKWFRRLQLLSAAAYSLGHGTNDAQKTMGIIAGLLVAAGYLREFAIPLWVILAAHAAIALGTLTGGWRIVHTMGSKITKLQPFGGFAAETAGAMTLFGASSFGIPVSTTHTITGAIIGVGAIKRLSAVRWGVAQQIIWAWILTIPASAIIAALTYRTLSLLGFR